MIMAKKKTVSTRNVSLDKSVKPKVIIEEGLEDNSQTQLLSDIYRRLEEYNNLFPKANFMMLSTNEQDKMLLLDVLLPPKEKAIEKTNFCHV